MTGITSLTGDLLRLLSLVIDIVCFVSLSVVIFASEQFLLRRRLCTRLILVFLAAAYVLAQLFEAPGQVGSWLMAICFAVRLLGEIDWEEFLKEGESS